MRLCRFFGLSQGLFLRLQMACQMAELKRNQPDDIIKITPYKEQDKPETRA